jgi:glucose/arabinose dehydrogenase
VHRRSSFLGAAAALSFAAPPDPVAGSTVPGGFVHEHLVTGPFPEFVVGFDFLPDGRVLLLEKDTGVVLLARPGFPSVDSVFTVPGVNADFIERGLLGVAVDPAWPARPYVYFDLTHVSGVTRIVMYEVTGDLADPQSTALGFVNPFLLIDDIPDMWEIHNAGTLRFGPDGMLYGARMRARARRRT